MEKVIIITILSLLALPVLALATPTPAPSVDLLTALDTLTNWLFTILLIVAVIFLIIFALVMTSAAGNPDAVERARNYIIYALIGVAVAVSR